MIDDASRPVETTQHHVAVGGEHFEVRRRVTHDGHVERAAAQIVNDDRAFFLSEVRASQFALHPGVGQGRGRRLVDDVDDVQAGDAAGILRRLAAHVVEVVRHGDDRVGDRTDLHLGVLFQLLQDQRGDEFRRQLLALIDDEVSLVAHLAFDRLDDVRGVFHGDAFKRRTDDDLPVFAQQHHRRRDRLAVGVHLRDRITFLVNLGQRRIGGSQVDSDSRSRHQFQ